MSVTHVLGIDPGLVHTGVVGLGFNPNLKTITVKHAALQGLDLVGLKDFMTQDYYPPEHIFVEAYNPRSNFNTDKRMGDLVREYRSATGGRALDNTGVLKLIPTTVMQVVGCWNFSTPTHHQDLRSAARIALLGMYKDQHLNKLVATVVSDHLVGQPWDVTT